MMPQRNIMKRHAHPEKQISLSFRFLSSGQEQMATLTTEFARYARQSLQKILDMNQKAYTRQYGK